MYGYDTEEEAKKAYLANYSKGWTGLGNITGVSKESFDKWLDASNRKMKPFAEYKGYSQTQSIEVDNHPMLEAIHTLYTKGKEFASKLFNMRYFDVAKTPDFMKKVGLSGDKFTIRYGVISRHFGKDVQHNFTEEEWKQLPKALSNPILITEYYQDENQKKQKGYRLYTPLTLSDDSYVVVSAEVKNVGRDLEINAINTIFGRDAVSDVHDKVVWQNPKITPEQSSLLNGNNPHQYPSTQELSTANLPNPSESAKEKEGKFSLRDKEAEEIVAKAKADGTYMKAPNGKDTNLTERQWAQVRTNAFKEWFGDWEKATKWNMVENLNATPIVESEVSEEDAQKAYDNIGQVKNVIDGKKVDFVKNAFGKIIRHKGVDVKIIMNELGDLFKESIPLFFEEEIKKDGHKDHSSNFVGYHHYLNKISIDGKEYYVRFTAQEVRTNPSKKKGEGFTPYQFHSSSISDIAIYENMEGSVESTGTYLSTGANHAYVDAKLADFLKEAKDSYENSSKVVDKNGEPRVIDGLFLNLKDASPITKCERAIEKANGFAERIKAIEKETGLSHKDTAFYYTDEGGEINEKLIYSSDYISTLCESILDNGLHLGIKVCFRYGDINDRMRSHNYRDDIDERGVSVVGRVADLNTKKSQYYDAFFGNGDNYNVVLGVDTGHKGADGEMLVSPAYTIGNAKDVGDMAKSATDNIGTFDGNNDDIRFSLRDNNVEKIGDNLYRLIPDKNQKTTYIDYYGNQLHDVVFETFNGRKWYRGFLAPKDLEIRKVDGKYEVEGLLGTYDSLDDAMELLDKMYAPSRFKKVGDGIQAEFQDAGPVGRAKIVKFVTKEQADAISMLTGKSLAEIVNEKNGARYSVRKRRALETVSVTHNEEHQQTVISSADGAKVLNNLDTLAENYENSGHTKEKTFIGEVAKSLGATRHGSNSEYATFETKNGKVVTIRLANHNAKVSNFDNKEETEGISIVVSPKDNAGIINDGNAHIVEFFYDAIKLRRADGKPLADIVRSIKQALYSGEFKDTTGLAERQDVNNPLQNEARFSLRDNESADKVYADEVSVPTQEELGEGLAELDKISDVVDHVQAREQERGIVPEVDYTQKLSKAVEKYNKATARFSVRQANERFNEELDEFKNKSHRGLMHLGQPSPILKACGVNVDEITLSPSVLHSHLKKHNLSTDDLKGLVMSMQRPILVYKHGQHAPNIVVVTELDVKGGKLSASLKLDSNGEVVEVSNISSIHSKDAETELARLYKVGEEEFRNSLRWVEKEKVLHWIAPSSYEPSGMQNNEAPFDATKVINDFVNPKVEGGNLQDGAKFSIRNSSDLVSDISEKGLGGAVGKEAVGKFVDGLYMNDADIRSEINKGIGKAGFNYATATRNFLGDIANGEVSAETWHKVRTAFQGMLRENGINANLTDADIAYALWKEANPGNDVISKAKDIAMQMDMGAGRFSLVGGPRAGMALDEYNRKALSSRLDWQEAWQDAMVSAKALQDAIAEETQSPITDSEDVYHAENRMYGSSKNEVEHYEDNYLNPLLKAVSDVLEQSKKNTLGMDYKGLMDYLMAKHGLERNSFFALKTRIAEEQQKRAEQVTAQMKAQAEQDYQDALNKAGQLTGIDLMNAVKAANRAKAKADRIAEQTGVEEGRKLRDALYDGYTNDADLAQLKNELRIKKITFREFEIVSDKGDDVLSHSWITLPPVKLQMKLSNCTNNNVAYLLLPLFLSLLWVS